MKGAHAPSRIQRITRPQSELRATLRVTPKSPTFTVMRYRLSKDEKLKSGKLIEQLFSEGKSISKFPLKLYFLPLEDVEKHKAAFAVPKRNFSSAVTRNRVKRQMREAYRLHKHMLSPKDGAKFALLFLYIGKNKPHYSLLESAMKALVKKFSE